MTRIVAGRLGGRRIAVPPTGTRPTSERVREAIFSAVAARIDLDGARVLDLYAGSGALGIEALSRGAGQALFVEQDRRAAAVLRRNLNELDLAGGEIRAASVSSVLAAAAAAPYDLVLADPPYATPEGDLLDVVERLARNGWLDTGSLVVIERGSRAGELPWPADVEPITTRRYGDTLVCYGRRP